MKLFLLFTIMVLHSNCLMHYMVAKHWKWTWIVFALYKTSYGRVAIRQGKMQMTGQKYFLRLVQNMYSRSWWWLLTGSYLSSLCGISGCKSHKTLVLPCQSFNSSKVCVKLPASTSEPQPTQGFTSDLALCVEMSSENMSTWRIKQRFDKEKAGQTGFLFIQNNPIVCPWTVLFPFCHTIGNIFKPVQHVTWKMFDSDICW